ncbi:nucleotidyltransferase family protein [Peptoniphilus equinus]|uniref:tRNA(Met) cytidine acetate ligase n=1 Tax=Peptoniphilus equinus TaxID=3016343 RepID=A0ABY7QS03_9FIRM|nr:nucleotidyltransferase family protein [Peptoniphilus equinus]WBW49542.1 nucleotidyltransferase family protein [Peptoniphilus equinus]
MISAIIAEYNPFHNGHRYQLEQARTFGPVVVIMSGSFTQRGTPAVLDKFTRAGLAARYGADLVLELPVVCAVAPATFFARGGVAMAAAFGADRLIFGAESPLEVLVPLADKISAVPSQSLIRTLKQGLSLPQTLEDCLDVSDAERDALRRPNNILALEYLGAIRDLNVLLEPYAIARTVAHHSGEVTTGDIAFASASHIRELTVNGAWDELRKVVPDAVYTALTSTNHTQADVDVTAQIKKLLRYREMIDEEAVVSLDYEDGLEHRLAQAVKGSEDWNALKPKHMTHARMNRYLTQTLLELRRKDYDAVMTQLPLRVLAIGPRGRELLRSKNGNRHLVQNPKAYQAFNHDAWIQECRAAELRSLLLNDAPSLDYRNPLYIHDEMSRSSDPS